MCLQSRQGSCVPLCHLAPGLGGRNGGPRGPHEIHLCQDPAIPDLDHGAGVCPNWERVWLSAAVSLWLDATNGLAPPATFETGSFPSGQGARATPSQPCSRALGLLGRGFPDSILTGQPRRLLGPNTSSSLKLSSTTTQPPHAFSAPSCHSFACRAVVACCAAQQPNQASKSCEL